MAMMLGIGLVSVMTALFLDGGVFALIPAALAFIAAGLVATGWRWAPAVASVVAGLLLLTILVFALAILARPHERDFPTTLLTLALALVALPAGLGATVQNYRGGERRAPGWLNNALIGLGGLVLGAILVGLIPQQGASAGVSADLLAGLPTLKVEEFSFGPRAIQVTAGETVALQLVNEDATAHSFDVDELDVHAPMPGGKAAVALFRPTEPGRYTFYCGIPGHANLAEGSGMVGTLIVEAAG